jgi:hypothetical protein
VRAGRRARAKQLTGTPPRAARSSGTGAALDYENLAATFQQLVHRCQLALALEQLLHDFTLRSRRPAPAASCGAWAQ